MNGYSMMKKFKILITLSALLLGLLSVSCNKDDMDAGTWDQQLVGTWALEEELCHVKTSDDDPYFEQILEMMIKEERLMQNYAFPDTIQFDQSGFYSQSGFLMKEEILESRYDFFPAFHVRDNLLYVEPWAFESSFGGKTAPYEISADGELLQIAIEGTGDYEFLRLRLEQSGEYDDAARDLAIQTIRFTQIYRKLSNYPFDEE